MRWPFPDPAGKGGTARNSFNASGTLATGFASGRISKLSRRADEPRGRTSVRPAGGTGERSSACCLCAWVSGCSISAAPSGTSPRCWLPEALRSSAWTPTRSFWPRRIAERSRARASFRLTPPRSPVSDSTRSTGFWSSFTAAYFPDFGPVLASWLQLLRPGGWIALVEMDDLLGHEPLTQTSRLMVDAFYEDAWRHPLGGMISGWARSFVR